MFRFSSSSPPPFPTSSISAQPTRGLAFDGFTKRSRRRDADDASPSVTVPPSAAASEVSSHIAGSSSNDRARQQPLSTERSFLSPDGRSFHSHHVRDGKSVIVSSFAPFHRHNHDHDTNDNHDASPSTTVTTILPPPIQKSIAIDPVIGLLGVGERTKSKTDEMNLLPWMCMYTSSSAFLLSVGYVIPSNHEPHHELSGIILHVLEPFEKPLLSPLAPKIVRIRPPLGLARCGSMACLVKEREGYSLLLFHGVEDDRSSVVTAAPAATTTTTTPLRFSYGDLLRGRDDGVSMENEAYSSSLLGDDHDEVIRVVDFCFASFASILLLCDDGSVYGASPLLFDGATVPRTEVLDAISRLDAEIDELTHTSVPKGMEARLRQCKAAKRYWMDAFGLDGTCSGVTATGRESYYVSASVTHHSRKNVSRAMAWQSRLQGPFAVFRSEEETPHRSSFQCIEPFGVGGMVEGFVVAGRDVSASSSVVEVGFGILPGHGAVLLPRFEFESNADCHFIDDLVRGTGVIVERALIKNDNDGEEKGAESGMATPRSRALVPASAQRAMRSCSLVIDPLDDLMVHVVTDSRIVTVSTTAFAVTSQCFQAKLEGSEDAAAEDIRTKVWSCLETASNDSVVGAGVSRDVHLGHILVARMSDGSMEVVNITATQCVHEASLQMEARIDQFHASLDYDKTPDILKKVKPLNELLQPLIDKVCNGLSKMGKIVGGNTLPKDAQPENLAVFIETQRSCEMNIVLPMKEISHIISGRRDLMREMHQSQAAELERLSKLLDELKTKYESNRQKVAELEASSSVLVSRSSAVLTATRDLRPQITDAEALYFKDLERYEMTCNKWDEEVKQICNEAAISCEAMSAGAIESGEVRCLVDLPPDKIEVCHRMLRGEKELLKKAEYKMNHSSAVLHQVVSSVSGLNLADAARLQLIEAEKENVKNVEQ